MNDKVILLCDCRKSQSIEAEKIRDITGLSCSNVYTDLCRTQIDSAAEPITDGNVMIACQQERHTFEQLAEELEAPFPKFVDIRDRAGWTDDKSPATAKMAALIAEAGLPDPEAKVLDVTSEGTCLVLGEAADAISAAELLCDALSVTVVLAPDSETPISPDPRYDIVKGTVKSASGALGGFKVAFDTLQERLPGGRGALDWTAPQSGGRTECDIIVDLRKSLPLVPAPEKREGYLRADPGNAAAKTKVILEASQLLGTFEKPLYIKLDQQLCAHSRATKTGCTRCLDLCPTSALSPNGDHVSVDVMACAGCGSCSAACPSGAITYDAPDTAHLFRRIRTLADTWRKSADGTPRLLVHDGAHGAEMIRLSARYGRGLPSDVIPLETSALASFGHAEAVGALASGFGAVTILLSPTTEKQGLEFQTELARTIAGNGNITLLDVQDPDQLEDILYDKSEVCGSINPVLALGTRRQITRLSAKALNAPDAILDLPVGSPYGTLGMNENACTLCLSCVSLCPSGALKENPDKPQLRFQEDACLQCGICTKICPESALELSPRLNLTDGALTPIVLKEEEPFECVECGKPFGVRSTVEKLTEKLAGKHSMFKNAGAARMIQMCDDCRVNSVYHSENNPFAMGERPAVRTTDDYISRRRDH